MVELDLGEHLVGKRGTHHKARVASGVAQVHQAPLGEHQNTPAVGKLPLVHLRLDFNAGRSRQRLQTSHIDFVVEVADVGDDCLVLHLQQVIHRENVLVSGRGDENVDLVDNTFQLRDLEPVHCRLQSRNGVNLRDDHAGALAAQRLHRAFSDVAVAGNEGHLPSNKGVGRTVNSVDQRVSDPVFVVELGLGHRVIDVNRGEQKLTLFEKVIEPVNTRGGLFGDTDDVFRNLSPLTGSLGESPLKNPQHHPPLSGVLGSGLGNNPGALKFHAFQNEHGGVATVVQDHVRTGKALC